MKKTNIQAELALIDAADISELKEMFRQEFGFDIQISNAETIKRRLQYRVQENICGGLTDSELATLDRIADEEECRDRKSGKTLKTFLPGTRLVRQYKGQNYEVTVGEAGTFIYGGETYSSLSAIAEKITGTHWNGKRFFGV